LKALDTNILVYAFEDSPKRARSLELLDGEAVISVQVLNEYASAIRRKYGREWHDISEDLEVIRGAVARVDPITDQANRDALRLVARYRLAWFDAVLIAVAIAGGARTLYSEDMQHGLMIGDTLRIIDPFR
jgi:predicted nucleic acid-binding protein